MKKRLIAGFAVALCALTGLGLAACEKSNGSSGDNNGGLRYNVDYIIEDVTNAHDPLLCDRFVIYADGSGKYTSYSLNAATVNGKYELYDYSETTVGFKYTFLDDAHSGVMCFFDSIAKTYFDGDGNVESTNNNATEDDKAWNVTLSVSENIVMSSYDIFIN